MNQNFSLLLLLLFIFSSCKKEYKYVEVVGDKKSNSNIINEREKSPYIIESKDDVEAYISAFKRFSLSQKLKKDSIGVFGDSTSMPIKFKLFDSNNADIASSVSFPDKEKVETQIVSNLLSIPNRLLDPNSLSETSKSEASASRVIIDTAKVKALKIYFVESVDEFSNNNLVWVKPKNAPKFVNDNGIYLYFQATNGMVSNLRFCIQYHASDWLFFEKVQFSIDGTAYDYFPTDVKRDSGNGGKIWEWTDQTVRANDSELITALANAKSAKMKIIGREYFDIKNISSSQIQSIYRTLEYFQALGGKF